MKIDHARLLADLRRLAEFGKHGTGVDRPAFSVADREAREWVLERMCEAGLQASIDGIGNGYGEARNVARSVLVGSHTDTVPKGGWLDGALGVVYALEIARSLNNTGETGGIGVDVINFADEEATFSGMVGSRSFCDELMEGELDFARNSEGTTLSEALSAAGYTGRPMARLNRARHLAYLEAHIEQGPRLEAEGKRIGVVTGIVGIRRIRITFSGQADHAGTTPMRMRRDAGRALVAFCHNLPSRLQRVAAAESVWNLGSIQLQPGVGNVVPGSAEVLIEYRDESTEVLDCMEAEILRAVAEADGRLDVAATASPPLGLPPARLDSELVDTIASAAQARNAAAIRMPSGAGHDAMVLSRHIPAAMVFIPSIGGRSHDPAEDSHEADIVLGADVLGEAVQTLVRKQR
jgi:N-carbamoyl-L-amino-acid hydrolase